MEKLVNYLRGLFNLVSEVERLRDTTKELQRKDHQRDVDEQVIIARIIQLTQRLEHSEQMQAVEARALKVQIENELLRFERRLPPNSPS